MVAALVDAAADEMAERGVEAASVRGIASRAGVNHGLVHRHFGSKQALLAAVLDRLAADVAAEFDAEGPVALAGPSVTRFLRVLARAILDGADVGSLQGHHPVMDRLLPLLAQQTGLPDEEVRIVAAQRMALELGWLLFEPFLASAAGLEGIALDRARAEVRTTVRGLGSPAGT